VNDETASKPGASSATGNLEAALEGAASSCHGILDVLLVDSEGVLVGHWGREPGAVDVEELAVEAIGVVPALGRAGLAGALGPVPEWLVIGERNALLVRRIQDTTLYLMLRVASAEWIGRARFAARVAAGRVAEFV
jgi:hypothetical protein